MGYEPNKNSIFNDFNLGGLGLNNNKLDNNNRFEYKKDLQPIIMKEKKNDNIFGYNNRDDIVGLYKNSNNIYGKNNKFNSYETNNPLINQYNNEITGF